MLEVGNENNLSIIKDPFILSGVHALHMHSFPKEGEFTWIASIEFENGMTEGKQKFEGNFESITAQMKSFMEFLEKK